MQYSALFSKHSSLYPLLVWALTSTIMDHISLIFGEILCYTGIAVSAFIVFKIYRMGMSCFINKLFFALYIVDTILGFFEVFFLFNLKDSRQVFSIGTDYFISIKILIKMYVYIFSCYSLSSQIGMLEERVDKCAAFITVWMFSGPFRGMFHVGMTFCR